MKKLIIINSIVALISIATSTFGQAPKRNDYRLELSKTSVYFLDTFDKDSIEISVHRDRKLRNAKIEMKLNSTPKGLWYKISQIDNDHFRLYLLADDAMKAGKYSLLISSSANNLTKGIVLNLVKPL